MTSPSDEEVKRMAEELAKGYTPATYPKPLTHKEQFIAMIEPRQSFVENKRYNAIVIHGVCNDDDLWIYFDRKTGEFLELRVES